ncbi:hypothetical protein TSOC_007634 [Tetrabaena socialis]|uniref:SET domain-containing protein n=2 Tax=Tetrabaena socialis TaxID=47790 RepID=A0A2J8A0M0_9CHLO|nr:hypothetical protein TSOC_007634 [Tetrabaena socialis]|eukprot:PNH06028.1 hypothetical protein TSOC_007634 [Tetrabaena socialis]
MRGRYLLTTRRWAVLIADGSVRRGGSAVVTASRDLSTAGIAPDQQPHALVDWVLQRGGRVDGVALAAGEFGGWGLQASRTLAPGTELILLPTSCHLTYDERDDPPSLLALVDTIPPELWSARLATKLIAERLRGDESAFCSYLRLLPSALPGIPMFFQKRGVDALDYPPVTAQVKKRCLWLYNWANQVSGVGRGDGYGLGTVLAPLPATPGADPFGGAPVDLNAFGWAMACVSSRAFRTRGPSHPAAMLPLIDMANHSFDPNVEVLPTEGGVGLFARRKIEAGEPLWLSYGKLSNDLLLLDYGFIVPNNENPYDTVQLKFDVGLLQAGAMVTNVRDALGAPMELTLSPWKAALLAELRLAGPAANTELNIGGAELLDGRLVAAARILVARQESEVAGRGAERLCAVDRPLGRENEAAALAVLGGVLAVALSNFATTLEQDLVLIAGAEAGSAVMPEPLPQQPTLWPLASSDELLAVRFRAEKKRILGAALQRVAELARAVAADGGLRETAGAAAAKKGTKPAPATGKGFGKKKPA